MEVADAALQAHQNGDIMLSGLYSHAGHSYGGDSRAAAIKMMGAEIGAMLTGADRITSRAAQQGISNLPSQIVSGGASPTAMSVQNLLSQSDAKDDSAPELQEEVDSLSKLFATVQERGHVVEIHAGVYPILDMQQLAAHSISASKLSWGDVAMTVIAEVHSTYPGRGESNNTPEALIGAGGLALGREFCKAYDGMAVMTPWGRKGVSLPTCDVEDFEGWTVGRFSQEHGILTWAAGKRKGAPRGQPTDMMEVGQKVRLWPNHACITSSHFGWYFVVDEDRAGKEDEIVDVWVKARGW
jgi:D-serine deaminase-like pyridoxal phosphate-dependent protein